MNKLLILEKILFLLEVFWEILLFLIIFSNGTICNYFFGEYTKSIENNILVSLRQTNIILLAYLTFVLYGCIKKFKDILVLKKVLICAIISQVLLSIINISGCLLIYYLFNNNVLLLMLSQGIYVTLYVYILDKFLSRVALLSSETKEGKDKKNNSLIMNKYSDIIVFYIIILLCCFPVNKKYTFLIDGIAIVILAVYILKKIFSKLGINIIECLLNLNKINTIKNEKKKSNII